VPGFTAAGAQVVYSYAVRNTGDVPLQGVTVTDPLPGLPAVSCPGTSLAAGASMTCTARYTITAADVRRGHVTSTGTVTGETPDRTRVRDQSTLTLSFTGVRPSHPGPNR